MQCDVSIASLIVTNTIYQYKVLKGETEATVSRNYAFAVYQFYIFSVNVKMAFSVNVKIMECQIVATKGYPLLFFLQI